MATGIRAERGAALRRFDSALLHEYERATGACRVAAQRAPGAEPGKVRWFCRFCPLTVRLCVSCYIERIAEHRAAELRFDRCLAEVCGHADAALR